jgi:hypothetical protein
MSHQHKAVFSQNAESLCQSAQQFWHFTALARTGKSLDMKESICGSAKVSGGRLSENYNSAVGLRVAAMRLSIFS